MNILVKIASRQRLQKLIETVDAFRETAVQPVRFLVSLDDDDRETVDNFPEMPDTVVRVGKRFSKIEAINRDVAAFDWDVLVVAADDMVPMSAWDAPIRNICRRLHDRPIALWCKDGRQDRICTIPAMTRAYYDLDGNVFCPEYRSYFCDDEWTEKAEARGMLHKINETMFRHDHPFFVRAGNDGLYDHNRTFKRADRETYIRRKLAGFP